MHTTRKHTRARLIHARLSCNLPIVRTSPCFTFDHLSIDHRHTMPQSVVSAALNYLSQHTQGLGCAVDMIDSCVACCKVCYMLHFMCYSHTLIVMPLSHTT